MRAESHACAIGGLVHIERARYTSAASQRLAAHAMFSRTAVVLAIVLGLAAALPVGAQWKWRDKSGQTQYSDLPPPAGVADQDILQRPTAGQRKPPPVAVAASGASAAAAAPALAAKASEPELEARRKKAEQDEATKKKAEDTRLASARAENCTRAPDAVEKPSRPFIVALSAFSASVSSGLGAIATLPDVSSARSFGVGRSLAAGS